MRKLMISRLLLSSATLLVAAVLLAGVLSHGVASAPGMAPSATVVPTLVPPATPAPTPGRPATVISTPPQPIPTVALIRPPRTPGPMPSMMSAEDQQQFGIMSASDVTADPSAVIPTPQVSASEAVKIAAMRVGFQPANARILHGSARPIAAQPERSVWVILFGGGDLPVLGPPGRPPQPLVQRTFTGVVVDDATGAVLTWFMR